MLQRLRHYVQRFDERHQEWRRGIATTEWAQLVDPAWPDCRGYGPTSYRDWRVIKTYITPRRDESFVDYGAGLGRVAILAAELDFKRVIGIDFDANLLRRAKINVDAALPLLRAPLELVCADAAEYDLPLDACTLFFCNPFGGPILKGALEKIQASYRARPRELKLICNVPKLSAFDLLRRLSWLHLSLSIPLSDGREGLIFSVTRAAEGATVPPLSA